ncbi:putative polygalacturonase [Bienertia sinuspersici]
MSPYFQVKTRVLYKYYVALLIWVLLISSTTNRVEGRRTEEGSLVNRHPTVSYKAVNCRKHSAVVTEFGAKGDGKTLNTKAFKSAINHLSKFALDGGAQLIVPPGRWLTGSFSLISHFTLFLHKDAVLLASQNNYIVSGDDCIAIKSGWDEYGIRFNMPTQHVIIRHLTCISPTSATIALGSEMSGGIRNIRAEHITAIDTESGVRIKSSPGRGAYVKDIFVRKMTMKTMKYVFWMTGYYQSDPDPYFNPHALPIIEDINYMDMVAENVSMPGYLEGIKGDVFKGICMSNVTIGLARQPMEMLWNCTNVEGVTNRVKPQPCGLLREDENVVECPFPKDRLPIEEVEFKNCLAPLVAYNKVVIIALLSVIILQNINLVYSRTVRVLDDGMIPKGCRKHGAFLTDFGGVGDGKTSNTKAFRAAIASLSQYGSDGGSELIVPPGKWLTGSFNLTSNFTLYLDKNAVLIASKDESEWPVLPPLPSYGRGRDAPAGRFASLIFGTNLTDVVITGGNATIDGQGAYWWGKFKKKELDLTRPYLIEIMFSDQVQIFNLTLLNSPSWNVHPVYSSNVIVQGLTIIAPVDSPNTDGINPDSCTNVRIEDNYIVSGDDCIAVKSGWDEYGIKFGMPTQHVNIRRLTCISPDSATIALGSEMSGGIQDIRAEQITAINTESGVRIKTAPGRGAYVKDIFVQDMTLKTMKYVFWMTGDYGSHPDPGFDPKSLPVISGINYRDVTADDVQMSGNLAGIENDKFTGICFSNVTITLAEKHQKVQWNCSNIEGSSSGVNPQACDLLPDKQPGKSVPCPFPTDKLAIDDVELKVCSIRPKPPRN